MFMSENLQEKWKPVLEHPDLPKIEDNENAEPIVLCTFNKMNIYKYQAIKIDPELKERQKLIDNYKFQIANLKKKLENDKEEKAKKIN